MLGIQLENAIIAELETDTMHDEEEILWVDGENAWFDTKENRWRIESIDDLERERNASSNSEASTSDTSD